MPEEKKAGAKTLLLSIIMSSPGPLVVGLGLIVGKSTTQIADFMRRSAELLAIIMSFVVYTIVARDENCDEAKRQKLENRSNIFVGLMMLTAGSIMAVLALTINNDDKGNIIPSLVIAVLSVIANSIFWVKYTRLSKSEQNSIFAVQSKLYLAKTLVDASVTIALVSLIVNPTSPVTDWFDVVGSLVVSIYLMFSGAKTVYKNAFKKRIG